MPSSASTGAAAMNGSETTTALAPIILMTAVVSSAQRTRSVRGVGWCSMVRLAPRIQMPCAVGAISTGAPASTATASPWPMPAAARPPATRRARSCTSAQVCRTGLSGSPVTMPLRLQWALPYIVSVNRLTTIPSGATAATLGAHKDRYDRYPPAERGSAIGRTDCTEPRPHRAAQRVDIAERCSKDPERTTRNGG